MKQVISSLKAGVGQGGKGGDEPSVRCGPDSLGSTTDEETSAGGTAKAWLVVEKVLAGSSSTLATSDPNPATGALGALTETAAGKDDQLRYHFKEPLYCNGRVVGHVSGALCLLDAPDREQQRHGTLTEAGVSFNGPVVIGDELKASGSGGNLGNLGSAETVKLKHAQAQLSRAVVRGDEQARQAAAGSLSELLHVSHKDSLISYVFQTVGALHECRSAMMSLWEELLDGLEVQSTIR